MTRLNVISRLLSVIPSGDMTPKPDKLPPRQKASDYRPPDFSGFNIVPNMPAIPLSDSIVDRKRMLTAFVQQTATGLCWSKCCRLFLQAVGSNGWPPPRAGGLIRHGQPMTRALHLHISFTRLKRYFLL